MDPIYGFAGKMMYPRCEYMASRDAGERKELVFHADGGHMLITVEVGASEASIFEDQHEELSAKLDRHPRVSLREPHLLQPVVFYTVTIDGGRATIEQSL